MFDRNDDPNVRTPRRIEVLGGPDRRRDWPDERKIAIVVESLALGVNVSAIARRHDINPQQLFGWRRTFRAQAEALIEAGKSQALPNHFTPVVTEVPPASTGSAYPVAAAPVESSIEISIGGALVRIRGAADARTLSAVLKALKVLK